MFKLLNRYCAKNYLIVSLESLDINRQTDGQGTDTVDITIKLYLSSYIFAGYKCKNTASALNMIMLLDTLQTHVHRTWSKHNQCSLPTIEFLK